MAIRISAFTLSVFVLLGAVAFASTRMEGTWKTTGGHTIRIPSGSDNFDLIIENGSRPSVCKAHWIKPGVQFYYVDGMGKHVAMLDPNNPDKATVHHPNGHVSYWIRVHK